MINIISLNTTWRSGETINLTDLVQIAPGVTLTIEAGAIVNGNNQTIQTFGTLKATGLASDKIEFNDTRFIFGGDNKTPGRIEISHALVNDGAFLPATGNSSYGSFSVTDSTLTSVQGFYIWYPTSTSSFERNIFFQSDGLFIGTSSVEFFVTNNVFAKQNGPTIQNWASYGGINLVVEHNSFLSTDLVALSLPGGYTSAAMLAENNYFGTTDLANISTRVYDRTDSLSAASVIDYDPILTQAHANTPIFNLVVASNTAPILSGIPGTAENVTVGTLFALADFTVADVDGDNLTVSLTATNGILSGVTDANASLAGTQLTGTAASINTALAAATFTATTAGTASITISLSDGIVTNPTTAVYTFVAAPPLGPTDDSVVLQRASSAIVGAGVGNDTYLLSSSLLPAGTNLTISDALGANSIQLASGLQIASAQVATTALKLNLVSGATITVLGADRFTFEAGGNTTAGINQTDISYSQFVQNVLSTTIPTTGVNTSAPVTIGGSSASGNQAVNATAAADVFSLNAVSALTDVAGTNTQDTISGFSNASDQLAIDFGSDTDGGQPVTLTLTGLSDPTAVQIAVV